MDLRGGPKSHNPHTAGMWLTLVLFLVTPAALSVLGSFQSIEEAPAFALTSTGYENGVQGAPVHFTLEEYAGQTVLLDMMAVTCTSCRVLTREVLEPLHAEFDDLVILSIDTWADPAAGQFVGETNEELIKLQQQEAVPWRHALDTDEVWRKYSAISLPKIVLVDPSGHITYEATGLPPLEEVRAAVVDAQSGGAEPVQVLRVGLLGLAFLAGVASFFSPCSVGLIPAYLGFLIKDHTSTARTLLGALATGAGIVLIYGLIALALYFAGDSLRPHLPLLSPIVAGLLVVFGALMLAGFSWDAVARRVGLGKIDGRKGFFAFGVGYGLAAFGCTGPIFLPILLAGFLEGAFTGAAVFALYTLAIAGFVVLAAWFVATGHQTWLRSLLAKTQLVTRVSALLLIAAGLYLLVFDASALL